MTYELTIPLKGGASIELEFDDLGELETKLSGLDLARLERILAATRKGGPRTKKAGAKRAAKGGKAAKATKKTTRSRA